MELDERLRRVATGISVSDAIEAYMREAAAGSVDDVEEARRQEILAIVEVMFLMAAVDGEVADEEIRELRASIEALEDLQELPGLELDEALADFAVRLSEQGWKTRLDEACARIHTPDAKCFALRLAAGVAFVDDFVAHAEAAAIDAITEALALDATEAQGILREVHETLFSG